MSLKERIVPRKKGTLAKVTDVVTGIGETVKNVGEIVEGIAGTVSDVAQTIRQKEDTPPQKGKTPRQKKVVQKPQRAATARAKPQPTTQQASTGTKARASRNKTTTR